MFLDGFGGVDLVGMLFDCASERGCSRGDWRCGRTVLTLMGYLERDIVPFMGVFRRV